MENNIKNILLEKRISITYLSEKIGMNYANTHHLVNRKDLGDTKVKTLLAVSKCLDVDITELWEE